MIDKRIIIGNWKMNLDHLQAVALVQKLDWTLKDAGHESGSVEVAVFPPFTDLRSVQTLIDADKIPFALGAQDLSAHDSGAYTGETSAAMLRDFGARYVLVGHSERRQYHGETDAVVAAKAQRALAAGITPIVCVGETLEQRESGQTEAVVKRQLAAVIQANGHCISEIVVAYEPVWACSGVAVRPVPMAQTGS
jgi:triosephosphate isomerase